MPRYDQSDSQPGVPHHETLRHDSASTRPGTSHHAFSSRDQFRCQSPSGALSIVLNVDETVRWTVSYKGADVLLDCPLAIQVGGQLLPGASPRVVRSQTTTIRDTVRPPVPTKAAELENHAQQLTVCV